MPRPTVAKRIFLHPNLVLMDNDQARGSLRLHVARNVNVDTQRASRAKAMDTTSGRNAASLVDSLHSAEPSITLFQVPEIRSLGAPGWLLPYERNAHQSGGKKSFQHNPDLTAATVSIWITRVKRRSIDLPWATRRSLSGRQFSP